MMKLTATAVAKLTLPKGVAERIYFDDDLSGFGLRLRKGGSRSFVVQYKIGSQHRRLNLGATALLDLSKARSNAKDILAQVRLGRDPQGEKAQARITASETSGKYLDDYLAWKQPQVRPNSYREIVRYLRKYASPWHARQLAMITQRDAADLIDTLTNKHGAPSANRAKAAYGPYFGWLLSKGRIDNNPFAFTPKAVENGGRQRVLSDGEVAAIWHACGDDQFGDIVKLLLLTGARRAEIGDLSWGECNGDMITIPEERSKNRREHEILLSKQARAILESRPRRNSTDFVFGQRDNSGFQGWSKAKAELDQRLAATGVIMAPWTLHDLRRTAATLMADRLGIEPHVIEALLNHVSGFRAGVHGIYNRSLYRAPKAEAMQRWADLLHTIIIDSNGRGRSQHPDPSPISHGVRHGRQSVSTTAS
jgi:integrase